jgi:hypothetical protein
MASDEPRIVPQVCDPILVDACFTSAAGGWDRGAEHSLVSPRRALWLPRSYEWFRDEATGAQHAAYSRRRLTVDCWRGT